ncbi:MAG: cation:proton antiporter [Alphaproteobacteria bacterium]|nr:cation:proton antiporter [Alphaproteobacteria bacterium]MDX5370029.1 cation:proton antiporter [Alphaproteobacteria bacterium]MDX5464607.1 cation:proton antiporter [Alphaproteobacteria bacterium]
MFLAATIAILVALALTLIRLFAGPSLYDRVLALNSVGTKTVLLIGVVGFLTERPEFLDIALLYALINFAGTFVILKFFRYRAVGDMAHQSMDTLSADTPHDPRGEERR